MKKQPSQNRGLKRELLAILLLFLVVLTAVSLISHSPQDPSLNHQTFKTTEIENLFGLVGAHLSGILVGTVGVSAFWIPIFLVFASYLFFRGDPPQRIVMTLLGGGMLMLSTAALLFIASNRVGLALAPYPPGGYAGRSIGGFLLKYANAPGATVILLFLLFIGFLVTTGLSALTFLALVRDALSLFVSILKQCTRSFFHNLKDYVKGMHDHSFGNLQQAGGGLQKLPWPKVGPFRALIPSITRSGDATDGEGALSDRFASDTSVVSVLDEGEHKVTKNSIKKTSKNGDPGAPTRGLDELLRRVEKKSEKVILKGERNSLEPSKQEAMDQTGHLDLSESLPEGADFTLPPLSLLNDKEQEAEGPDLASLKMKAEILEVKLNDFGVKGEIVDILPGPVITTFEYRPAPGVKISKIVNLTDDIALALSALSIRINAPIPGKDVVGVEIPNDTREMVLLKEMLSSEAFGAPTSKLTVGLGKDILGHPVAATMDRMPHLLIAGATGTGKSVGLNSMIISLLYKAKPDEVKFIMVDPKRIELSVYDGIPHLISPVVTDMKKATNALFWAVREMERRYELLAQNGVRNLGQYNTLVDAQCQKMEEGNPLADATPSQSMPEQAFSEVDAASNEPVNNSFDINGEDTPNAAEPLEKLPYIVVIVDEFADLMMVASKDVESALIRLAQMARAAGIHLILATQRPSVDVLTGIIKANFPTRLSFQVSSRTDSRTILDTNGAERLLGNGDMLFLPPGTGRLQRIQGAYISEDEIAKITTFLKNQQTPQYVEDVTEQVSDEGAVDEEEAYDEKYDQAVALITRTRQASISSVQRHLRIGYNRAARIIETMEREGIVGPQDGSKPREVLVRNYDD